MKRKPRKQIVKRTINKCVITFNFDLFERCHISQVQEINSTHDGLISTYIGIPIKEYRKFMIENLNAKLTTYLHVNDAGKIINVPAIYFNDYSDAKKALEWIESSTTLINRLSFCG